MENGEWKIEDKWVFIKVKPCEFMKAPIRMLASLA